MDFMNILPKKSRNKMLIFFSEAMKENLIFSYLPVPTSFVKADHNALESKLYSLLFEMTEDSG